MSACPFCDPEEGRRIWSSDLALVLRDGYPVSKGHTLVVPVRHVASLFETSGEERMALFEALDVARAVAKQEYQPAGFNIGVNDGPAAGQTVAHCHIHLIPRYDGDQPDPRGGVRWIFPDKAKYWSD